MTPAVSVKTGSPTRTRGSQLPRAQPCQKPGLAGRQRGGRGQTPGGVWGAAPLSLGIRHPPPPGPRGSLSSPLCGCPPAAAPRAMQEQTQGGEQVGRKSRGRVVQGHHGNRGGRRPVTLPLRREPQGGCVAGPSCSPLLLSPLLSEQGPRARPTFPSA